MRLEQQPRALFLAVIFAVARHEIVGRIQTETDINPIVFRSGLSSRITFVCANEEDAHTLAARFDSDQFVARIREIIRKVAPDDDHASSDMSISTHTHQNTFVIMYDFPKWGRYYFDLGRFKYIFDLNDPIAKSRNTVILQAVNNIGQTAADENPLIQHYDYRL